MIDDEAFDAMAESLRTMAQSRPPRQCHAATVEQVDLVSQLLGLARQLQAFCAEVIVDGAPAERWQQVAGMLDDACRACRAEVVIEVFTDPG